MMSIPTNIYSDIRPQLNIADLDVIENAAGPGKRFVLWMQGCKKSCPGCANKNFAAITVKNSFHISNLFKILQQNQTINGISLSGGEPLLQSLPLIPFLKQIQKNHLSVVCYTGYTLKQLVDQNNPIINTFLNYVDLLIDGDYRHDLPRAGAFRPSSNQKIHFLSNHFSPESLKNIPETVFSITDKKASITGTLPDAIKNKIVKRLGEQGIFFKF